MHVMSHVHVFLLQSFGSTSGTEEVTRAENNLRRNTVSTVQYAGDPYA